MHLDRLWIADFRNYANAEMSFPADGLTAIVGDNGQGKTNLLEAIAYAASFRSFRGAQPDSLVKRNAEASVVRALGFRGDRELLIECEIKPTGRTRALVNKQVLRRSNDIADALMATVFSPDDLDLVKSGPAVRRGYLDDLLASTDRRADQAQRDLERVLKQRNTLLRQSGGRLDGTIASTLDVWDAKFSEAGEICGTLRQKLVEELRPHVAAAYRALASDDDGTVEMHISTIWRAEDGGRGLISSLIESRQSDLARGATSVGPHRDELSLSISGMPARTHASQGEQRTLALALRLASHRYTQELTGEPPLLLLDDVFSELDSSRSSALVRELPPGQIFLSTTSLPPAGMTAAARLVVSHGSVEAA